MAIAPIRPLAWEAPCATGAALEKAKTPKKKKKKKEKKRKKKRKKKNTFHIIFHYIYYRILNIVPCAIQLDFVVYPFSM